MDNEFCILTFVIGFFIGYLIKNKLMEKKKENYTDSWDWFCRDNMGMGDGNNWCTCGSGYNALRPGDIWVAQGSDVSVMVREPGCYYDIGEGTSMAFVYAALAIVAGVVLVAVTWGGASGPLAGAAAAATAAGATTITVATTGISFGVSGIFAGIIIRGGVGAAINNAMQAHPPARPRCPNGNIPCKWDHGIGGQGFNCCPTNPDGSGAQRACADWSIWELDHPGTQVGGLGCALPGGPHNVAHVGQCNGNMSLSGQQRIDANTECAKASNVDGGTACSGWSWQGYSCWWEMSKYQ